MAFNFSPKLVIDGLRMCLDAANTKSYNGGVEWNDISHYKNNAVIIGGVTYNPSAAGTLEFDGISGYIESVPLSELLDGSENFTIQMIIYPTDLQSGVSTTLFDTVGRHLSVWIGGNINDQFWGMGSNNGYYNTLDFNWENNVWQMITLKKEGSVGYIIKNNHSHTYTFAPGTTYTNQLVFGYNPSGGSPISNFKGLLSFIVFYNRSLSEDEINGNYIGIKSRGGL